VRRTAHRLRAYPTAAVRHLSENKESPQGPPAVGPVTDAVPPPAPPKPVPVDGVAVLRKKFTAKVVDRKGDRMTFTMDFRPIQKPFVITPDRRVTRIHQAAYDRKQYNEELKSWITRYRNEWNEIMKEESHNEALAYYTVKRGVAERRRQKNIQSEINWKIREKKMAEHRRQMAIREEVSRRRWVRQQAAFKAERMFQLKYLMYEKTHYWRLKPEDIKEDNIFGREMVPTGWWPAAETEKFLENWTKYAENNPELRDLLHEDETAKETAAEEDESVEDEADEELRRMEETGLEEEE